jgi:alpha/beta superfamily hydrolase
MTAISQTKLSFDAYWSLQNCHLKDSLSDKICKFALHWLYRFAMKNCLPAHFMYKNKNLQQENFAFQSNHQNNYILHPIEVKTPDGALLKGTFLQHKSLMPNAPCTIIMQPNATIYSFDTFENLIEHPTSHAQACNFVLFDYRECGESQGEVIHPKDLIVDGDSIYQFVKDYLQVPPSQIHAIGHSLGGGVAAQVYALHPSNTGNLVIDRSFSSIRDAACKLISNKVIASIAAFALKILGWDLLNSAEALKNIRSKTLVCYHPYDEIIKKGAQLQEKLLSQSPHITKMHLGSSMLGYNIHGHPLEFFDLGMGLSPLNTIKKFISES